MICNDFQCMFVLGTVEHAKNVENIEQFIKEVTGPDYNVYVRGSDTQVRLDHSALPL